MIDFTNPQPVNPNPGKDLVVAGPYDLESAKEQFSDYIQAIATIEAGIKTFPVIDKESYQLAGERLTVIKSILKKIDEQRKTIIEEPANFVKFLNAFCKIFTDKLTFCELTLKEKIKIYLDLLEQKRREQEALARKEAEALQKKLNADAKKKGIEPVQVPVPIIPTGIAPMRTETGSVHTREVWTFKIVDPNLIPREYLIPNETSIRKAVNAGTRVIPGVEIYISKEIIARTGG